MSHTTVHTVATSPTVPAQRPGSVTRSGASSPATGTPVQPHTAVGSPSTPVERARAEFRRLLAARTMTGRPAALYACHPGREEDTTWLEQRCNTVEDALEEKFPRMWAEAFPTVAVPEAALLHDPADSPLPDCVLCAAAAKVAEGWRFGPEGRLQPEVPNTPARAAALAVAS